MPGFARNIKTGHDGEQLAVQLLKKRGYKIIDKNYRSRLGEIDVIAKDKDIVCFIEVKARSGDLFGAPQEAVTIAKQRHMANAALMYLKEHDLLEEKVRFDVVSIVGSQGSKKSIELIKDAFEV